MKERKKERSNKIPSNLPAGSLFTATTISRTSKRVRTLTLWLLHACVTRSQREINILRTRNNVLSAKTHYSHVHSVERIFSHATNVFKDSRRPGTDRVASSARSWKSYHVSYKLHIKRILRIIVTILGTIVREYMTTRHRRFEGISIEIEPLHGSSNDRRSARDA